MRDVRHPSAAHHRASCTVSWMLGDGDSCSFGWRRMTDSDDPLVATVELPDDAEYGWWLNTHPDGFVLAVRTRSAPLLHRATCPEIDRDVHPGRLKAKG